MTIRSCLHDVRGSCMFVCVCVSHSLSFFPYNFMKQLGTGKIKGTLGEKMPQSQVKRNR